MASSSLSNNTSMRRGEIFHLLWISTADEGEKHHFWCSFPVSYTPPQILMDSIRSPDTPDELLMDS
jgi:hypothetical protein